VITVVVCSQCARPFAPAAVSLGVCPRCGASPAATSAISTQISVMPGIEISQLARLDELAAPSPAHAGAPPQGPFGPDAGHTPARHTQPRPGGAFAPAAGRPTAPNAFAPPTAAFRPPPEIAAAPLGVERSTRAIRIANASDLQQQLAAQRPSPIARPSGAIKARAPVGGVVAAVALMAAFAIGIAVIVTRPSAKPQATTGSVSIRVIAPEPTAVTIDGYPAGKTPLTLRRPISAQPIVIAAPGTTKHVIPDHDQIINLSQ
jgi:hypothetical protein